jgi:hypothetical protein
MQASLGLINLGVGYFSDKCISLSIRSCLAILSLPTLAGTDRRVVNSKSEVDSLSWRLEEKFKKSSTLKFSKTTEQLVNWNKLAEHVSCNKM